IICPSLRVTLVDSLEKRVRFLKEVSLELGLGDRVRAVHSRVEDFARLPANREAYDFAVSRAVAKLNVLLEYCLPLVRVGGVFVAMKGPGAEDEMAKSNGALARLGGEVYRSHSWCLPGIGERRTIVVIRKKTKTPSGYPRRGNLPREKPL
ncbi:MAG: 16S rRNA (guanine(527)-N(7))-methyltransferase RsmG, partial [bacterium]|nr:16S rRNA (guanine(527)-N(7))-methyltransferase RsmG [bacterium]